MTVISGLFNNVSVMWNMTGVCAGLGNGSDIIRPEQAEERFKTIRYQIRANEDKITIFRGMR